MPRLCSDSSRPYTPQGGTILSPGRSASRAMRPALRKIPERTTGKPRSRLIRKAISGCERIMDSQRKQRVLIAPCRATCRVMRQKSADAIVAQRPG